MLRRFTPAVATTRRFAQNSSNSLVPVAAFQKRRHVEPASTAAAASATCSCVADLVGHLSSITVVSTTNLLFTPLGTIALIVLAYNVNYVGLKHLWYTSEFPMRDYLQDAGLKQALRYVMLITLLLTGNGLFIEP